jgi:hypothetical protein
MFNLRQIASTRFENPTSLFALLPSNPQSPTNLFELRRGSLPPSLSGSLAFSLSSRCAGPQSAEPDYALRASSRQPSPIALRLVGLRPAEP